MNKTDNQVNLKLISDSELQEIRASINELKDIVRAKNEQDISETYIESKNVPKLLGICNKTWQTYRDKGKFSYIQIGSKIWIKRSDLDAMMNKHYIKSSV